MNIGVIAAEEEEMLAMRVLMSDIEEISIFNLKFYKGILHEKNIVLVKCGVGKVNAARTTQILIDNFKPNYVINVGSAGGVNENLSIGDIVIGEKLVQYDFDLTGVGSYEKGEICDIGKFISSDEKLVKLCKETIKKLNSSDFNAKVGIIASADMFCADYEKARKIRDEFSAECVEMEGAAVAQVCFLDSVPVLVIRGISDTSNGNNEKDFHTYLKIASKRSAELLEKLLSKID